MNMQELLVNYLEGLPGSATRQVAAPLQYSAEKFARRLAVEQERRGRDEKDAVEALLDQSGVARADVLKDVQLLADDAITSSATV
mmetsp:Transcript_33193/g.75627  ORF Transcript_33193/g.75627 Transcript_33193/m.75627 type:complete len:85 (-) Transcript_33193:63-317(-)